ncbi:hypothetical protein FQA47_006804 [Oryzias melastigma]|uniref:Uncharacterized protein n=1 Tax=Oryzias melastigma TaxID=30732 RepID=A0A834CR16_ORYME|nr:hypothetical protein FQA47_006804 [Oryzias melastigma]
MSSAAEFPVEVEGSYLLYGTRQGHLFSICVLHSFSMLFGFFFSGAGLSVSGRTPARLRATADGDRRVFFFLCSPITDKVELKAAVTHR